MAEQLKIAANKLISLPLKDVDGNYFDPADLSLIAVQIIQRHRIIVTYTLDVDPEVRILATSPENLEIEITKALSVFFIEGDVFAKLILEKVDSEFIVDGEFRDMPEVLILNAVL